jgi:hypothetical protein
VTVDIRGHTDQGVLSGNTMTLNVVQTDGSIQPITYQRASPADYNTALVQLQQSVQSANQQAQQQQNQSNLTSAAAEATGALQSDNANFSNAKTLRDDLAKANTDLAKERQDAANGPGANCYNIDVVVDNDAAYVVGFDVTQTALNDTSTEQLQLNSIRGDIAAVQNTQAALKAAGLPATPGADSAIATAHQHVAEALITANSAIDALNADLNTAYDIANKTATGACAGHGPGTAPSGPQHVS